MTKNNSDRHDKGECGHAHAPHIRTAACDRFFTEESAGWGFICLILDLALTADRTAREASKIMHEFTGDPKFLARAEEINSSGAKKSMERHLRRVLEMSLCRSVDNYLTYISDLLASVFRTRPETLRSSETVRLDVVLKHDNMEDLIADLADKRVNELSYRGLKDLSDYLKERLSLSLFPDAFATDKGIRIVEERNLLVHARGVVNAAFLRKVPNCGLNIGDSLPFTGSKAFDSMDALAHSVVWVDGQAINKFQLKAMSGSP